MTKTMCHIMDQFRIWRSARSSSFIASILLPVLLSFAFTAQASVNPTPYPKFKAFGTTGTPLSGGKLYTYSAGTTTAKTSYSDPALSVPNTNPIILDSRGEADVYLGLGGYKLVLKTSSGTTLWTLDNVQYSPGSATGYGVKIGDYASVSAAITAIGSTPTTLVIDKDTPITAATTFPATLRVKMVYPGRLTRSGSYAITFNGGFEPYSGQLFTGSGLVTFSPGSVMEIDPVWFGAIPDDGVDDSTAVNAAIATIPKRGTIKFGPGVFEFAAALRILEKPITVRGTGQFATVLKKMSANTDAVVVVEGCDRARVSEGYAYYDAWWQEDLQYDLGGVELSSLVIEGGDRGTLGSGIIFRGKNSDMTIKDIHIYNFKGSGMKASDPYGATGLDTSAPGALIQESVFDHIEIKNCGYSTGTYATSHAALEIGRNDVGTSNHNNLWFKNLSVIYPRWIAVRVLNKNASGDIHELKMNNVFIHGNESLVAAGSTDKDGLTWATTQDLMVIGNRTALSETHNVGDIKTIQLSDIHVLEMENGKSGVYVGNYAAADGVPVNVVGALFEAGASSYGITFDGAGTSYVGEVTSGLRSPMQNAINLTGLSKTTDILTLGAVSSPVSNNGSTGCGAGCVKWINIGGSASLDMINDTTVDYIQVTKEAVDSLPGDVWGGSDGITAWKSGRGRYWRQAYFIPSAAVTAHDTDYAQVNLYAYGSSGALYDSSNVKTKTAGSGGTGNWTKRVKVNVPYPSTIENIPDGGYVGVNITKSGAGVTIPAGTFIIETSMWRYY